MILKIKLDDGDSVEIECDNYKMHDDYIEAYRYSHNRATGSKIHEPIAYVRDWVILRVERGADE